MLSLFRYEYKMIYDDTIYYFYIAIFVTINLHKLYITNMFFILMSFLKSVKI